MVDPEELFNTLDDGGAGAAPKKMQEGDSPSAANGAIGFAFKDSSGNVVLPQLNAAGQIPTTETTAGTCLYANGELAAGNLALTDVTNAQIILTVAKTYIEIGGAVSCRHASLFQWVHVDDSGGVTPVETVIAEIIVGPGQYSIFNSIECFILDTTGGTGVILLKIVAQNFSKLSSLRASIAAKELT